jgi:hypothetical protein
MKRFTFAVLFVLVSWWAAERLPAQSGKTLDQALTEAAAAISAALPGTSGALIGDVDAPAGALSEYIAGKLASLITAGGALTLVERSPEALRLMKQESDYQRSGLVREETVAGEGERTGAALLLTGSIVRAGELYALSVRAVDLATAEVPALYTGIVKPDPVLEGLVTNPNAPRPQWVDFPLEYGRTHYEHQTVTGPAAWYYDLGVSGRTSTEQRARTRARENLQQNIAANIASNMGAYIDVLELSAFGDQDVEDVRQIVSRAVSTSIQVKLPSFEVLEWHIERGAENGAPWCIAYLLARFPRQDIIRMVQEINPAPIAQEILRALTPPASPAPAQQNMGELLLADMLKARTAAIEALK